MSVQTSYNFATDRGVAGGLYDLSPKSVNSFRNEADDGVLKFGMGVVMGTNKGVQVDIPAAGATLATFEGIVLNGHNTEMDMAGNLALKNDVIVGVITHGKVWARIKSDIDVAYGDPVYLIIDGDNVGLFTNEAEVSEEDEDVSITIEITGAKFVGTKGTGNIAPVELK